MKHKMWYDNQHEIFFLKLLDDFSNNDLKEFLQLFHETMEGKPFRQLIVDMEITSKLESRETRELLRDGLLKENISDVALVGFNAAGRIIAKILFKRESIKTNGGFFKDMEEAIIWLKSKR